MENSLPPQMAPHKSPEQLQLDQIGGAIRCAHNAAEALKKVALTLENIGPIQEALSWIEGMEQQLRRDWGDLHAKLPQAPMQPAVPAMAPPLPPPPPTQGTAGK